VARHDEKHYPARCPLVEVVRRVQREPGTLDDVPAEARLIVSASVALLAEHADLTRLTGEIVRGSARVKGGREFALVAEELEPSEYQVRNRKGFGPAKRYALAVSGEFECRTAT
jgi:hypothetical protein